MARPPWAPNAAREKTRYFPRRYAIRAMGPAVMGPADGDFRSLVLAIVRRQVPGLPDAAATARPSSGGKWVAVTVTFMVQSRADLNAIYRDLAADERVVWAL